MPNEQHPPPLLEAESSNNLSPSTMDNVAKQKSEVHSSRRALLLLVAIFVCSLVCLGLVYHNFPTLEPAEKTYMKLPKNMEDAKNLGLILSRYSDRYYFTVLIGILVTYIFLQVSN